MKLIREREVAADWDMTLEQFRVLRRRHKWAHVEFSRQDIRYTEGQLEQIVNDMTVAGATRRAVHTGQTERSRRASSPTRRAAS